MSEIEMGASLNIGVSGEAIETNSELIPMFPKWVRKSYVNKVKDLDICELVREWLVSGYPDNETARRIQEHGYLLDHDHTEVRHYVTHYKATIPKIAFVQRNMPKIAMQAERKLKNQLDVLESMAYLAEKLKGRMEDANDWEKTLPAPMPEYNSVYAEFGRSIKDFHSLQKDYGLLPSHGKDASGTSAQGFDPSKVYTDPGMVAVMKDPQRRMKVMGAIDRALKLGKRISETEDISHERVVSEKKEEVSVGLEIDLSDIETTSEAEE